MSAWSARAVLGASLFLPLPPALAEQAVGTLPPEAVQVLEQAGIRAPGVGAYLVEPGAGRPLVQVAADQPFTAASTMKLVTTIAALEQLSPQFRWSTPVLMTGRIEKGVLTGDLVIRGGNDPVLTWARLDDLVKRLRKRRIDPIQGDIMIDRGLYFAPEDETRMFAGGMALPFNALPDSLVVNGKTVTVHFVADARTRSVTVRVIGHREYSQRALAQLRKNAGGEWRGRFEDPKDAHHHEVIRDQMTSPLWQG